MNANNKFETWALVELFGHQRIIGKVTEQSIGGAPFIRVDVPGPTGETEYTRLYGPSAIYCISPIDQETAVKLAQACDMRPVKPYEVPQLGPGEPAVLEDDDGGMQDEEE